MSNGAVQQKESTRIATVVREELKFAWRIVFCAIYISWWRIKHFLWNDPKLSRGALIIGAISALVLLLDILMYAFGKDLPVWLGRSAFIVLVPTASLLALHRVGEAVKRKREASFANRVGPLVDAILELSKAQPKEKDAALTGFMTKILKEIHEHFGTGKRSITVSVMTQDRRDGKLRITYLFPPGTQYDPNIAFAPGEGGAGYSFSENKVIYIPAIGYMHGIIIGIQENERRINLSYGLKRRLYVPIQKQFEIYESFLCLPLTSGDKPHAVLNVDSQLRDTFDISDIHTLRAYARVLGDGISICI